MQLLHRIVVCLGDEFFIVYNTLVVLPKVSENMNYASTMINEKALKCKPRHNLTEGEQTGMKPSCIKPHQKSEVYISIEPGSSTGYIDACIYIVRD